MESDDAPQCIKVQTPDGRIVVGPTCDAQGGPRQEPQHKILVCCVAQEISEEESYTKKEEEITIEKDA